MNLQEWELLAAAKAHQLTEGEERQVSRIDEIRAAMRRYEAELLQLERLGDGARFVDGDVIRFTKTHTANDDTTKSYTYAAIKTPAGWYLTGQHRSPQVTYDELITYITNYPTATDVQVAAGWISIDEVGQTFAAETSNRVAGTRGFVGSDDKPRYEAVSREDYRVTDTEADR